MEVPNNINVPSAYQTLFKEKAMDGIALRRGQDEASKYYEEYAAKSRDPSFDFASFVKDYRNQALAGLNTPSLVGAIGVHLDAAIGHSQGDYRTLSAKRLEETNVSNLSSGFKEVSTSSDPQTQFSIARDSIDRYVEAGGTRAEGTKYLLDHVIGQSKQQGGVPSAFDIFYQKDPDTGKTLADLNPALADNIATQQRAASHEADITYNNKHIQVHGQTLADFRTRMSNGEYVNMSDAAIIQSIQPHIGERGIFTSGEKVAHFLGQIQEQRLAKAQEASELNAIRVGNGAFLSPDVQQKRLKEATAPLMASLMATLDDAKPESVQASQRALGALQAVLQNGKFSAVDDGVKALVTSVKNAIPKEGDKPTPRFLRMAEMYQALKTSGNPGLAHQYFDQDSRDLFENYNADTVQGQVNSPSAYYLAYKGISPEAKAAVETQMKDPAITSRIKVTAEKAVLGMGSRIWQHMPFTEKSDTSQIQQAAIAEAKRLIPRGVTDPDKLGAQLETWAKANYFLDKSTNSVIPINPAMNNDKMQEAVTGYMGMVVQAQGEKFKPKLVPLGGDKYQVAITEPSFQLLGNQPITLQDMMNIHKAKTSLAPSEEALLGELKTKAKNNVLTPQDLKDNELLLTKARTFAPQALEGPLKVKIQNQLFENNQKSFNIRGANSFVNPTDKAALDKMNLGDQVEAAVKADPTPIQTIKSGSTDTRSFVEKALQSKDYQAALTGMGEELRTVAYKDSGGIPTIGVGYNLKANAANISEDFRKAGIPADKVDAVVNGKSAITTEQAYRLYQVALPRYEAMAKSAIDTRGQGSWDSLPANVKTVVVDMAYQTGNNVKKFQKGIENLLKGDYSGEGLSVLVPDSKNGGMRQDTRRHDLRKSLLTSATHFEALLGYAKDQPANQFQYRTGIRD